MKIDMLDIAIIIALLTWFLPVIVCWYQGGCN